MKLRKASSAVIALDLGGTKLAAALFTPGGKLIVKSIIPLNGRAGADVGRLLCREISRARQTAVRRQMAVKGIGVSVPGVAWSNGVVWAPNIPEWEAYPLRRELQALLRPERLPLRIESDRACYILGEAWQGAARGCRNAIFLAVGTGIGAGILVDGRLLRGADDIAGAAGWMALQRPFLPAYQSRGCFESHAAGPGLAESAGALDAPAVFAALRRKHPSARKAIRHAVELWGMAAANLASLFNPEKIIFGGGLFGPAACFLGDIRAEAERWAQPLAMRRVEMEGSALGSDAGLYGAAFVAIKGAR